MRERLYRSRTDRAIGGLAAGMARNLGIDVTWVRFGWLVAAVLTQGAAVIVYLALLFVIPEEPGTTEGDSGAAGAAPVAGNAPGTAPDAGTATAAAGVTAARTPRGDGPPAGTSAPLSPVERVLGPGQAAKDSSRSAALIVGVVLIAAGAWLLLRRFIQVDFELAWPVIAVVLGVVLVVASVRPGRRS